MYEKLKLYRSDWVNLSSDSLEFVKAVLKKNPETRLTPQSALYHPFIRQRDTRGKIKPNVLQKLANSSPKGNHLKKEIFLLLTTYIKSDVIEKWNKIFNSLDKEGNGMIKISEVINQLKETKVSSTRLSVIENDLKENLDATISYSDFLFKVVNIQREIKEEDIQKGKYS